ncbi:MAG: hypothetical protein L0206_19630 [Actinobacteria bacterium]|nr:hypothetical protein [Actinomycetota bacterium]
MTRRLLVAALASASLLAPAHAAVAAEAQEVPLLVCDIDWRQGTWHIKRLIRCAARRWDSPGTPTKAVEVARCESHLRPDAFNPNGYAGLFQQPIARWPERADRYGQPDRSVFNARANIIVSVRMARALGSWSAWSGCG